MRGRALLAALVALEQLDLARHVQLGDTGGDGAEHVAHRGVGDAHSLAHGRDLGLVLDLTQALDEPARGDPVEARAVGQLQVAGGRELIGLEADALRRGVRERAPELAPQLVHAVDNPQRQALDFALDLRAVAEVDDQRGLAAEQQERGRPAEAGEVADVRHARHEQRVGARRLDRRLGVSPAPGVVHVGVSFHPWFRRRLSASP